MPPPPWCQKAEVPEVEEKPDEPAQLTLNEVLPGAWQVQIQMPFPPGVMGELRLELSPAGMFRGQLMTPMGMTAVEGQWQANPMTNQIGLQGRQSNGFQTMPYVVMVQVTHFDAQQIAGITSAGEQVAWQRLGTPVTPPLPKSRSRGR